MVEDLERAQDRLDNIRTVEPLLGALRTISLGGWQAALKQRANARRYGEQLLAILPLLLPYLRAGRPGYERPPARVVALMVGSERGLCGRFNAAIVERAERYLAEQAATGVQVELEALGSRIVRLWQRQQQPLAWSGVLSATALPSSHLAFNLTRRWLARYEAGDLDAADLIYNVYRGTGRYEPTVVRLIPPQMPAEMGNSEEVWPPPIVETDPLSLYARVVGQWAAIRLYELLLESVASEQAARFQLMEAATQNAERLIDELTIAVQTARRQAITREMQELAAGAGLLGRP